MNLFDSSKTGERITIEVASAHVDAVKQLVEDYAAGKVRVCTPPIDLDGRTYAAAVAGVERDERTSYFLRRRIAEDGRRDAVDALADAELQLALLSRRFGEMTPEHEQAQPNLAVDRRGAEAVVRLTESVKTLGGAGAQDVVDFLLAAYDGARYRFDLTVLERMQPDTRADCLRLLQMGLEPRRQEIQLACGGAAAVGGLAYRYRVLDWVEIEAAARDLANTARLEEHVQLCERVLNALGGGDQT